ncbi:hypothetical protein KA005_49065 [bacterium]|nr:hypothetical protein [bacterium]
MTFIKDAVDKLRGKKKNEKPVGSRLEELGLSFMASQETKERITRKKELFEILYAPLKGRTPEAKIKDLYLKVNKINMILHETDVPYGRGGARGWYSEVAFAWTDIYAISNIFIESTMRQIERANLQIKKNQEKNQPISLDRLKRKKETLLINIEHFYVRITRAYAEKVAACSWFPEDVGRNWAAIINTFKDKPQRQIDHGRGYNVYREGERE